MPVNHDFKVQYQKVLREFIKGSILVRVKAKRLYKLFSEWMLGKDFPPFDDLPIQEQKAWVMCSHKIPFDDYDEEDGEV